MPVFQVLTILLIFNLLPARSLENPVKAQVTPNCGCQFETDTQSTLALSLAVAAHGPRCKTLILDTDPQHTVADWWHDREADAPDCVEVKDSQQISRAIEVAKDQDFDLVFIDTPGRDDPINARVISVAHFCLIPCRPAMADMRAQRPTVDVVKRLDKGGGFVLMQTPARGPRFREAQLGLGIYGLPVAPMSVVYRQSYNDAHAVGMGVTEYDPQGKASQEISALWRWVKSKIGKLK